MFSFALKSLGCIARFDVVLRWPPARMNLPLQEGNACTEVEYPPRSRRSTRTWV